MKSALARICANQEFRLYLAAKAGNYDLECVKKFEKNRKNWDSLQLLIDMGMINSQTGNVDKVKVEEF